MLEKIEREISILRECLKDSFLTAESKAFIWDELEELSAKRDELLVEQGVEIQPWD